MYIAQTYFSPEIAGKAEAYVYYVELPGNSSDVLALVVSVFRELGDEYAAKVSLFAPDRSSVKRIRSEVERELRDCFTIRKHETPGIIVAPRPITYIANRDDWVYLPLGDNVNVSKQELREILVELIDQVISQSKNKVEGGLKLELKRLWDAVELKPGFLGVRFDVKKYVESRRKAS